MTFGPYQREKDVLIPLVKELSIMSLQFKPEKRYFWKKPDHTWVTIYDYVLEYYILKAIHESFPHDLICAEENLSGRQPPWLNDINSFLPSDSNWRDFFSIIKKKVPANSRYWVIDPIDGTSGFKRGDHFAIAIALIENSKCVFSICAWPTHKPVFTGISIDGPAIFYAGLDCGAWACDCKEGGSVFPVKITHDTEIPQTIAFANYPEPQKGNLLRVMDMLGKPYNTIIFTSMAKAIPIGCGKAYLYIRPVSPKDEAAHDIAPVSLFVTEAGGNVTLGNGKQVSFDNKDRVFNGNTGFVLSNLSPEEHRYVCEVFSNVCNIPA